MYRITSAFIEIIEHETQELASLLSLTETHLPWIVNMMKLNHTDLCYYSSGIRVLNLTSQQVKKIEDLIGEVLYFSDYDYRLIIKKLDKKKGHRG